RASGGNSLLSVVMQLSMSLGVAAAGALLAAFASPIVIPIASDVGPTNLLHTFHATYVCMGALSALAAGIFFQLGGREGPTGAAKVVDPS
ncbi:MAG: MFS transporter, partial [Burkholderiales bacterium]